jgi:hypothetical protein
MKDCILIILFATSILGFTYFAATYDDVVKLNKNTSSHVEEMYHRQLVVTLDSILDARFGAGCYKEVIDSDDVSVPPTLFRNHASTPIME